MGQENKAVAWNDAHRTHHILILCSDGHHNMDRTPDQVFPLLCKMVPKDTKILVVIVGLSQNSSMQMGMLLKSSVETLLFSADDVHTIYFASTRASLKTTLATLEASVNRTINTGTFMEVKDPIQEPRC